MLDRKEWLFLGTSNKQSNFLFFMQKNVEKKCKMWYYCISFILRKTNRN